MLKSALMNDLIAKHPMDNVRYTKPVRAVNDIKFLTIEEQQKFMEAAKRSHIYNLQEISSQRGTRKESETLSQVLEYIDRRTGKKKSLL